MPTLYTLRLLYGGGYAHGRRGDIRCPVGAATPMTSRFCDDGGFLEETYSCLPLLSGVRRNVYAIAHLNQDLHNNCEINCSIVRTGGIKLNK